MKTYATQLSVALVALGLFSAGAAKATCEDTCRANFRACNQAGNPPQLCTIVLEDCFNQCSLVRSPPSLISQEAQTGQKESITQSESETAGQAKTELVATH
jgi:hypothetical protein